MRILILNGLIAALWIGSCKTATQPLGTSKTETEPAPAVTQSGGSENLYAHRWVLIEAMGEPVVPAGDNREAHLLFYPGQLSRVSGSTGCNRLNGTFELTGVNKIKFSPLATTKMMCPPGNTTEERFLKALEQTNNYYFADSNLMLLNGKILAAKLQPAPAQKDSAQ